MDSIVDESSTNSTAATDLSIAYPTAEYLGDTKSAAVIGNSVLIRELLGSASLLFWSVQLLPQVIKNYRDGSTAGLSSWMLVLWSIEACLSGAYLVVQKLAFSLTVQSELFLLFSLVCSAQCYYYSRKRLVASAVALFVAFVLLATVAQVGIVLGIRAILGESTRSASSPHQWLVQVLGITPVILSILGFVPQYIEVFKLQSSYGLSKCFLFLDMQGAVFALGCLAFHESFDLLAAANAASILVLDIGLIFICMMFYRRASHGYSAKVPPSTALTIDREEQPGADQLSVTNVEWWPTALDLHDDAAAAEAQKDGIIQELGVLRKKLSVKRKYSASSSTHAPAACLPSQQTITMVTIPLARAHTMDMNYAVPETRVTSTFPPRPPTPLAVPEST